MNTYNLNFKGYWRDLNRSGIPDTSGIYLVYKCVYNENVKNLSLIEILYIGQAENLRERIDSHEKRSSFFNECNKERNEIICYSVTEVEPSELNLVENALIYAQKPKLNEQNRDKYSYEPAIFHIEGDCILLREKDFTLSSNHLNRLKIK